MDKDIKVGDLKWGKVDSHPWWPGVIITHPVGKKSKKIQKNGTFYHFHFLSTPPTRGWVKEKNIRDFKGIQGPDCQKNGMFYCQKESFQEALQEAEKAWSMTNRERVAHIRQAEAGEQLKEDVPPVSVSVKEEVIDPHESPGTVRVKEEITDSPVKDKHTYILGKTKIPLSWQTPYVLIDFKSVPEDLTEDGFVKVPEEEDDQQKSSKKSVPDQGEGRSAKSTKRKRENSSDEEDDLEKEVTKKQKKDHSKTKSDSEDNLEEEDVEEFEEEEIPSDEEVWEPGKGDIMDSEDDITDFEESEGNDDDEDDDWIPGGNDENNEDPFKTKKKKSNTGKENVEKNSKPPPATLPSVVIPLQASLQGSSPLLTASLKSYLPPALVQDSITVNTAPLPPAPLPPPPPPFLLPPPPPLPTQTSSIPVKPLLISTPSPIPSSGNPESFEPEVGDFLIEKAECSDGNIPFLWRYKKGGLIQKYEKKTDGSQTYFQNVLNFSDWWSSAAHKYQKVDTQVIYKYKNVERVVLIDKTEANKSQEPPVTKETDTGKKDQEKTVEETPEPQQKEHTPSKKSNDKTQEEEVSSTTPDSQDFQIGYFVLDKKDERNTDGFPIWKIESSILLRKFEAVVKHGKLYHQPMKTYRGYKSSDIAKFYTLIKVRRKIALGPDTVEVLEEYRPKVVVDSSMEEEYDKHPLLRHFYIYLQVFLSQALEPGFLEGIKKNEDNSFTFSMGEIDKIIGQKIMNVERKVRWGHRIKKAMKQCPYLREVYKPDSKKHCEALEEVQDTVEENVFLFGPEYDSETLKRSPKTTGCQDFKVGPTAVKHICTYHKLCHFKFNLYEKCTSKIKLIRERKKDADVTEIMDSCLGNKAWVLQNFEDFMTLVEMVPCS